VEVVELSRARSIAFAPAANGPFRLNRQIAHNPRRFGSTFPRELERVTGDHQGVYALRARFVADHHSGAVRQLPIGHDKTIVAPGQISPRVFYRVGAIDRRANGRTRYVFDYFSREDGATVIEYGLIAALIAVVALTVFGTVGTDLTTTFSTVTSQL
jgi:pilus assembly protein Flp/PilA